jgi:hypothetical protein
MKKIMLFLVIVVIFMSSCSKSMYSYKKPTRRQIKEGMKYSTWEYKLPTQSMYSNYTYTNYDK